MSKHKTTRGEWVQKAVSLGKNANALHPLIESHRRLVERQHGGGGGRFYCFAPTEGAQSATTRMYFDESVLIAQLEVNILRYMADIKMLAEQLLDAEITNGSNND